MKFLPFVLLPLISFAQQSSDVLLNQIFTDYHEYVYRNYPESATYEGDNRYNNLLTDLSDMAHNTRYDSINNFRKRLLNINRNTISVNNQLNYDLFLRSLDKDLESKKFNYHYLPINQMGGIHIDFPQIIQVQPLRNYNDYLNYIERLNKFPLQVKNVIENMKSGLKSNLVPPKIIMEKTLTQIENIIKPPVDSSVFMVSINENVLNVDEKKLIKDHLRRSISNVNNSYKELYDFIKIKYLPTARVDVGIWALSDGNERYKTAVRNYTSLDNITPQQVFETGISEIERIKSEMEKVKSEIGFNGTLKEFNSFLRNSPEFYFTNKDSLMNEYRRILSKMDTQLPKLFSIHPKTPYDLKEIEEFRAKSAPAAYYYSAPEDGSRPGYFYVNTYDLVSRPKYTMTALALHEAVPGHHTQIAIAKEKTELPWFRRELGVTAFVEGWALYAESLGYETGMYDDLYQKYGALSFEMWRACRLVVDAGMHHLKWTKEMAVDLMRENLPTSELDINSEVERYIAWPGQALAYKIGELKIKELRKRAENELKDKFDIREFHSMLLEEGALPLAIVEKRVQEWIDTRKK